MVEQATVGRTLRKRKEKVPNPKHLKRGATENEMDNFTKRVLRIPISHSMRITLPTDCGCSSEKP